ncbi:hypothetical protein [Granulosicoccus antarcticus]|uniref:hypothetical protein n=1 Tax=Granulosicoccus antarcticus TaxID=437505 RepID=UPI001F39A6A3|nr:hypothetical protein [Granulosicoccus antarcticus]
MKSTCIKVLKVRVKDRHAPLLRSMATEVNQVWNYCNDLSDRMIRERGRWMSGFDFSAYTVGASKQFEHIGSSTIQETAEHYASKRYSAKRRKLRWRKSFGDKRSLGWVPFKARAAHWKHGQVFFAGSHFKVWDSFGLANTGSGQVVSLRMLAVDGIFASVSRLIARVPRGKTAAIWSIDAARSTWEMSVARS